MYFYTLVQWISKILSDGKMTSIRAKVMNFLLRNRYTFRFQRKEAFDFNTSIQGFRDQCERGAQRFGKVPPDVRVEKLNIGIVPAEYLIPVKEHENKIILYVHGGGYVSGSCNDHRSIVARLVQQTGIKALLYEYRLAPEYQYPAALDDSLAVYNFLLDSGIHNSNIIITGESAGGGLTLCLLLKLRDNNIPLPSAAAVMSPWTDLKCTGESYKTKSKVSLAPYNSWNVFSKYYVGETDPGCQYISPLYGDLSGLPPILIYAGESDELIDDSIRFEKKAANSGSKVLLRTGKEMVHCYPLLPEFIPESKAAFKEFCEFIRNPVI